MTLSVGHGTLGLGTQTGLTVSGSGTVASPLVLSGPLSSLNADLPSLVYTPTAGYSGSDTLNLTILDTTDQASGTKSVAITVNPLPALNAPATVNVNENSSVTLSGGSAISVTDTAGSGNNNETLTLTVGHGTLGLGTQTGLTVTGNGTAASPLVLSGSLSSLNADLPSLVYTPTAGYSGSDTLNLAILDTTDQASGAAVHVAITVNPLPVVNAPATVSVNENSSVTLSGGSAISVTDTAGSGNDNGH